MPSASALGGSSTLHALGPWYAVVRCFSAAAQCPQDSICPQRARCSSIRQLSRLSITTATDFAAEIAEPICFFLGVRNRIRAGGSNFHNLIRIAQSKYFESCETVASCAEPEARPGEHPPFSRCIVHFSVDDPPPKRSWLPQRGSWLLLQLHGSPRQISSSCSPAVD